MKTELSLRNLARGLAALLLSSTVSAHAAPIAYSFSTGAARSFGGNGLVPATPQQIDDANALAGLFSGSSISGTFDYNPATPAFQVNADGSVIYSANPGSSFVALSAQVSGGSLGSIAFSDPRGFTQIGNETFGPAGAKGDIFQLFAEPSSPTGTHNLSGISLGAFSLYNVRMFWIEGQATPETVPDLFSASALPGTPPPMHGRMALDFIKDGVAGSQTYVVFFDELSVSPIPEPETYALLLSGLALLAFMAWRRQRPTTAFYGLRTASH